MEKKNLQDPYVQKPVMTVDGRPWTQRCFVCLKSVNFLKSTAGIHYLHIGQYVRHKKCSPI